VWSIQNICGCVRIKNEDWKIILKYTSKKVGVWKNWTGLFGIGLRLCGGLFQQVSESLDSIKFMELTNCGTAGFSSRALLYGTDVIDKHNENLK